MKVRKLVKTPYAAGVLALVSLAWCWLTSGSVFFWLGAAGFCGAGWRGYKLFCKHRGRSHRSSRTTDPVATPPVAEPPPRPRRQTAQELGSLVEQMISDGRYALLLRPQIAGDLTRDQFRRAYAMLEEDMALVPTGEVGVELADFDDFSVADQHDQIHEAVVRVDSLYMDRYPVTNEQFQAFVDAGGYEQSSIWHPEVLPAVLDFVDKSGMPGPRLWNNGRYPPGKAKHPVIGVSWFEACAYARWAGKRLPTDAEWVKAASWPVALGTSKRRQRRYPWGQAMDRERANLWSASCGGTVAVDEFAEGVSVGGVYQLIGNVWEWTLGDFDPGVGDVPADEPDQGPLKNVRGGAYDTYFENQATCQFVSGEMPLARKHNIGFRCVLGTCDLAVDPTAPCGAVAEETLDECEVTV
jgi:formylglycine-generating enzyme required for sulfatase activity